MFCIEEICIKTKINNEQKLKEMAKPIVKFTEEHNAKFYMAYDKDNRLLAHYEVNGKTLAYCKGVVAEIKQMFKDIFKCKIEVLLKAY